MKKAVKKKAVKKVVKKKAGRKSKEFIFQENKELILRLTITGSTNDEICEVLGIGHTQFYLYRDRDQEFKNELIRAKVKADTKVENALLKRATGYDLIEEHTEVEPVSDKADSKVTIKKIKRIKKHIPGDSTAMIFWLKNRRPDKWRDKQEHDVTIVDLSKIAEDFDKVIGAK